MEIERKNRARIPGLLALLLQCVMLVAIIFIMSGVHTPAKILAGTIALVSDSSASGSNGITLTVDTRGRVRYGSRSLTVREISQALYGDITAPAATVVTISAPANADAAVVARLMHEVRRVGVKQVRLSIAK